MEQFDKLCEVQSDKASVEVNSAGFSLFLFGGAFSSPSCGFLAYLLLSGKCGGFIPRVGRASGRPVGSVCHCCVVVGRTERGIADHFPQITSRYDGVIKKLHYEAGDMAIVGKVSTPSLPCCWAPTAWVFSFYSIFFFIDWGM